MNSQEKQAIAEVLESYFTPDSPEGLAGAMYQLRRIYETNTRRIKTRRRPQAKGHAEGSNHGEAGTAGRGEAAGSVRGSGSLPSGLDHRQDQEVTPVISWQNAGVLAHADEKTL
jgi:hypothetical protein